MNATRKPRQTNEPYAARRQAALEKAGTALLLVTHVPDVSYFCGFAGDDSFLLIAREYACLLTDGRYGEQARNECPGVEVFVRTGPMFAALAEVLERLGRRGKIAVQAEHMTLAWRSAMEKVVAPSRIKPVLGLAAELQQIKDAAEIAAIRRAIRIAERAFASMLAQGKRAFVGRTERAVAGDLEYRMRLAGADKAAFDTIVAAGPHGSQPHYHAGETKIRDGQPVLFDWGALSGGYCSDLTRVVLIGKIRPEVAEIYQTVLRAQAAGFSAICVGAEAQTADAAAREVIASAGYADRFVHGLGHGIGRQVHALPGVGKTSRVVFAPGMVVTVEPGIYIPGKIGVRIEDDALVTLRGPVRLSTLGRELSEMWLK